MIRKYGIAGLIALIIGFPLAGKSETINWQGHAEGVEKAVQENKKIFIHFQADWCTYCVKMDEETFSDSEVIRYLNEHFIPIRVNGDREAELRRIYKVPGYPDNRFLTRKRDPIFQFFGFQGPEVFMVLLKYVHTDSFKTMTPVQFLESGSDKSDF